MKLAQEMLIKVKARIHELDHWRDKEKNAIDHQRSYP